MNVAVRRGVEARSERSGIDERGRHENQGKGRSGRRKVKRSEFKMKGE